MEKNLIRITESEGKKVVSARELHKFLEASERFSKWFERQLQYGFEENQDYVGCKEFNALANQELMDYAITIDMAKEISMLQRTEKGKQARKYFIECERVAKLSTLSSYQIEDPIKRAERWIEEQKEHKLAIEQKQARIEEMKPKEEFFDQVTDSKDACDMATVSKVLNVGIGRNRLFEILRDEKVLMGNNQPMQRYVDAGYFRIVESKFTKPSGDICINFKTIVYKSGIIFIRRLLEKLKDKKIE